MFTFDRFTLARCPVNLLSHIFRHFKIIGLLRPRLCNVWAQLITGDVVRCNIVQYCAMCNVQCAMCNVQCAMCNLQYAICNMQNAKCNMQYAICNMVQCAILCDVQYCAMYSIVQYCAILCNIVQYCAMCNEQCAICNM